MNATDPHTNLRQMIKKASDAIAALFKHTGKVHRIYHCVNETGAEFVEQVPWCGSKDATMEATRDMLAKLKVVAYVCIDEGWMLDLAKAKLTPEQQEELCEVGTALRPDERVEVVLFAAEDHTGFLMGMRDIVRPTRGKATLGPLRYFPDDLRGTFEGRMVNLLPQRGRLH